MARRTPRPTDRPIEPDGPPRPWDRRPDETSPAYAAFRHYCKLGGERAANRVAADLGKSRKLILVWSSRHEWVARAAAWDTHMAALEQERQEKVRAEYAERWERRRLEAAEANWDRAQRVAVRAEEMLKAPLFEQTVTKRDADGRPTEVTIEPAKWTLNTAGALLKLAAELQAAALGEALGGQDDDFDPATASPEECRAYLAKMGMKGLPAPKRKGE